MVRPNTNKVPKSNLCTHEEPLIFSIKQTLAVLLDGFTRYKIPIFVGRTKPRVAIVSIRMRIKSPL